MPAGLTAAAREGHASVEDNRAFTYKELTARLGIDRESARRWALRNNWRKVPGSALDREVRVLVPKGVLPPDEAEPPALPEMLALALDAERRARDAQAAAEARCSSLEATVAGQEREIQRWMRRWRKRKG